MTSEGPTLALDLGSTQTPDDAGAEVVETKSRVWGRLVSLTPGRGNIELRQDRTTIGRKGADMLVDSPYLSQQHCEIIREGNDVSGGAIVWIKDTSTNGTYVNDEKVGKDRRILLQSGHEITLVKQRTNVERIAYVFNYRPNSEDGAAASADASGPSQKYEILSVLGQGNFAIVKLAVDRQTGEKWALKCVDKKKLALQPSGRRDAMQDEVRILQSVRHRNIIQIRDVFDTPSTFYLVLELVTGGELFDRVVEAGHLSEPLAREVFTQLLDAVAYLHDQGIAHRDLKPENIFLASKSSWEVKIGDFGLSRNIGDGSVARTLCGTPQYIAPEILSNAQLGGYGLQDEWALGCILYVLLTGTLPFDDTSETPVFDQIRSGDYSVEGDAWRDISKEAKDLVCKLMTVDPARRLTAAQALRHPWVLAQPLHSLKNMSHATAASSSSSSASASASVTSSAHKPTAAHADVRSSSSAAAPSANKKQKPNSNDNNHRSADDVLMLDGNSSDDERMPPPPPAAAAAAPPPRVVDPLDDEEAFAQQEIERQLKRKQDFERRQQAEAERKRKQADDAAAARRQDELRRTAETSAMAAAKEAMDRAGEEAKRMAKAKPTANREVSPPPRAVPATTANTTTTATTASTAKPAAAAAAAAASGAKRPGVPAESKWDATTSSESDDDGRERVPTLKHATPAAPKSAPSKPSSASAATTTTTTTTTTSASAKPSSAPSSTSNLKSKATPAASVTPAPAPKKAKSHDSDEDLPVCQYGTGCYRKNPKHFKEFAHPWLTADHSDSD